MLDGSSMYDATSPGQGSIRRIIGYFFGERAGKAEIAQLRKAAPRLTHVNYAFGVIDEDGQVALGAPLADTGHEDGNPDEIGGNFAALRRIKDEHPHLQVLISLGGWGGSRGFSDAAATEEGRRKLVASTIELYLTRWPGVFDGIDIDWEYPVHGGLPDNGYRPDDRRNCTLLFEEYRRQLDDLGQKEGRHYPLTAAVPAGNALPVSTFELGAIADILDFVNVMTYDITGSGTSGLTGLNAALREAPEDPREPEQRKFQNIDGTVRTFLDEGVPAEKLVVGMPFYGRGYTGVGDRHGGLFQPFTGETSAKYHQIARDYLASFERHWHEEAGVPWLYNRERQEMLTYDDPESIGGKAAYIVEHGLGGAMFWELTGDDDDLSLLTAISDRFRA